MDLRAELEGLAHDASLDEPDRALAVAALLSEAMRPLGVSPVLVGGSAVLFWTRAPEFTTVDIDLVVDEPNAVDALMSGLGFVSAADRRHWSIPNSAVLVEMPARVLEPAGAQTVAVEMPDGRWVDVLSPVDLVIARAQELLLAPLELPLRQVLALIPVIPILWNCSQGRARSTGQRVWHFMRRNRCSGA